MNKKLKKIFMSGVILLFAGLSPVPAQAKKQKIDYKNYFTISDSIAVKKDAAMGKLLIYDGDKLLFKSDLVDDTIWTKDYVNVRKHPTIESEVVKVYAPTKELHRVGKSDNGWDIVKIDKKYRFIWNQYITTNEPDCLGYFKLTAYCSCSYCSEGYGHHTSTGAYATEGITIAVDPDVIPYGTHVWVNGNEYIAQDCGGAVNGNHIDIYMDDEGEHNRVENFGVQHAYVYLVED